MTMLLGGVSTPICLTTGELRECAMDVNGNMYEMHPDTKVAFKGTIIPNWSKVEDMCKEASKIVKDAVFTGWDICVLPSGDIELIEANAMPDIGVIQFAPNCLKRNVLKRTSEDLLNNNIIKLTSIWSRSYRNHEI